MKNDLGKNLPDTGQISLVPSTAVCIWSCRQNLFKHQADLIVSMHLNSFPSCKLQLVLATNEGSQCKVDGGHQHGPAFLKVWDFLH